MSWIAVLIYLAFDSSVKLVYRAIPLIHGSFRFRIIHHNISEIDICQEYLVDIINIVRLSIRYTFQDNNCSNLNVFMSITIEFLIQNTG